MSILQLNKLSKSYGRNTILRNVNLTLERGSVLGLLGVNGAGKTTLLKTALGLLKADSGEAQVFGQQAWDMSPDSKEKIGYVGQKMEFFSWMTGSQLLEYTGAFYLSWDERKVLSLAADWELDLDMKVAKMSEGQRQRLSIVLAMGHCPELIIFDEPVASLDPAARRLFIKRLIEMNLNDQTTVIFSTHITSDIERVAADVAILSKAGEIAYQGSIDELKEQVVRLHIQGNSTLNPKQVIPGVISQQCQGNNARLAVRDFRPELAEQWQRELNASIRVEPLSLEDIFLELNQ